MELDTSLDPIDISGPHAAEARFVEGVDYCGRFLMGMSEVHEALYKLTKILEEEQLPYAIIGALALNEYGHKRATVGVDLVMRDEDLQEFKQRHLGRGYAERVPATGKLLDTVHNVHIDVLSMPLYIELELASGMVAPHRAKDLVDVQELIKSAGLPRETADELDPWVRAKFLELWELAQTPDPF